MPLRVFGSALCLLLASFMVRAEPASEASVRKLLDVTGAGAMGVQVMQQMLPELKKMLPQAPEPFWEKFVTDARPEDLVSLIVPIYQRHYSEEDVQAAIAYFSSASGQRLVEKQSLVMQESFEVGQQWGVQLAERAIAEINARKDAGKDSAAAAPETKRPDGAAKQGD